MNDLHLQTPYNVYNLENGVRLQHLKMAAIASTLVEPSFGEPSRWMQFLSEVTGGSEDLQRFIQTALGYTLTGSTDEQKIFLLHGPPASGKSTFLSIIQMILGDFAAANIDLARVQPGIANIRCLISTSAEYFSGQRRVNQECISRWVSIAGGDLQISSPLYKDPFSYQPKMKIWTVTHQAPKYLLSDSGISRRLCAIPFSASVKRDPDLVANLISESPAILAWMMRGASRWIKEGLTSGV